MISKLLNYLFHKKTTVTIELEVNCEKNIKIQNYKTVGPKFFTASIETPERIVHLCLSLTNSDNQVVIRVPSSSFDLNYYDTIEINLIESGRFNIRILEADAQSFHYFKIVRKEDLLKTINEIHQHCAHPKSNGYKLKEF